MSKQPSSAVRSGNKLGLPRSRLASKYVLNNVILSLTFPSYLLL